METIEKIRDFLSRLTTLTGEELEELRGLIVSEFERVDGEATTTENVAVLNELADAGDQVLTEQSGREEAAAQAEADKQAARERIGKLNGEADEEEAEAEGEKDEPEAEAEAEEKPEAAEEPEPVAASGVRRMASRQPRPAASPEAQTAGDEPFSRAVLTATGALRGLDTSTPLEDREQLGKAMAETLQRMNRGGAARGDVVVASASWQYPDDRRLGEDAWENTRKMEAVTGSQALVATGGICLPVNVDYSVPTWATAERPLRDGLPAFQATRGGLRFVQPPDIGTWTAATGIWTEATDASPGASTKPVVSLSCGTEELTYVEAVSTRLGFGNMQSRFAPEQVAANTDLAIAAAARIAENNLLDLIAASCVADVTSATLLGATRDLITVIDQVSAGYRSLHRIPRSQTLTAIFPDWLKDLLRVDLARELAHDNSGAFNVLQVTDAQVEDLLRAHGVNPIFHLDGQSSSVAGGVAQVFGAQSGTHAVNPFPTKLVWYVFAEGQFQFLDGGRLDLGVVRDSTLDATNDYETFVETFEGVAYRGFANGALQMVSTLCANGGSAATISTAGDCA